VKRKIALLSAVASLTLATAACGADEETAAPTPEETTAESPMATDDMTSEDMAGDDMAGEGMDPAANLVGPGCADYASQVPDGAGSVSGMAQDPVATAASNNPLLTTLTAAVSGQLNPEVNLVDTLNGGEFTVFAPVDEAFAELDQATLDTLATDADALTGILTYHVVPGQLGPDEVVGTQTTVQGDAVEVAGSGDELTVNGASVICGNVHTANARVYLIDTVLTPMS
jgi:uncharacterized surface protein with fasciclin (FAS1) repeats